MNPQQVTVVGLILTVVATITVGGGMIWLMRLSRRHHEAQAAAGRRTARAWIWVFLMTTVILMTYMLSGPNRGPRSPEAAPLPGWFWAMIPALFVLLLARAWIKGRPLARIRRKAAAGDIAGAIRDLEARVDRRCSSATGPTDPANPWVAPAGTSALPEAERQALMVDLNLLGILEGKRDDWGRALAWFERGAAIDPANPIHRGNQGHALVKLGQVDVGLERIRRALAELPTDPNGQVMHFNMSIQLANSLLDARQVPTALAAIDAAEATVEPLTRSSRLLRKQVAAELATLRDRARSILLEQPS